MSSKYIVVQFTSGALIPVFLAFLGEAFQQMIPWFIAMFSVVIADLLAGLWKSIRLDIPIRFSKACRETMGKLIVYFAFVCMACCINVADNGEFNWCRYIALFVIIIELGSMASNILKPHGINISMTALVRALVNHSIKELTCPEVMDIVKDENLEEIRQQEYGKYAKNPKDKKPNGKKGNNKRA